jgi:hypothetical protein
MFALKTDMPQKRKAHCILWPMLFIFYKIQGRQNSQVSRISSGQDNKKKGTLLRCSRKKTGDAGLRPSSLTDSLGDQSSLGSLF